jgi:hypothetical protein
MFKKVVVGGLIVGVAGALIIGAVQRTTARTEAAGGTERQPVGGGGRGGSGYGGDWPESSVGSVVGDVSQARNGWVAREGGASGTVERSGAADQPSSEWLKFTGVVSAVDADTLEVQVPTGEVLVVEGRAWSFAQANGFATQPGDEVRLSGFYENGEFEVGMLENLSLEISVLLRAETGRPLWAGAGRRGPGA